MFLVEFMMILFYMFVFHEENKTADCLWLDVTQSTANNDCITVHAEWMLSKQLPKTYALYSTIRFFNTVMNIFEKYIIT